jgi:Spy/CpxP family protein refolding chaperone
MKKLLLIVLATGFFAFNSNAQVQRKVDHSQKVRSDSSHHFRRGGGMDNLNLTADQKAQMKSLHENNKQQREAIKNDASLTPDQKKAKMKDLYKAQSDKMNSILTPDQRAQRKANMEKMRANRKMHGKKGFKKSDTAPVQSKS